MAHLGHLVFVLRQKLLDVVTSGPETLVIDSLVEAEPADELAIEIKLEGVIVTQVKVEDPEGVESLESPHDFAQQLFSKLACSFP